MDSRQMGKMIRKYRKDNGLTQAQLAENVGVSVNFLGTVERGQQLPSLETLVALANTLCVTTDELLMGVVSQARSIHVNVVYKQMQGLLDEQITMVLNVVEQMTKDFKAYNKSHHIDNI